MKIIYAKHPNCCKEFIFEVPKHLNPKKNDLLYVETMCGNTIATATTETIETDSGETIAQKQGAYLPLKKVITYANEYMIRCIKNGTIQEVEKRVIRFCNELMDNANEDIPF